MQLAPHVLVILDGWGYRAEHAHNAIYQAHPQNYNYWLAHYPHAFLHASGRYVGLLDGMIGNSEVGHLTIGSGRIIKQPVATITDAINNGSFFNHELLITNFKQLQQSGKTLHIMGLLSDAGVHSLEYHLFAFITMAVKYAIKKIVVHCFLDGRDVPPKSAALYLTRLQQVLEKVGTGIIGSIHGRFYAMDRDNHWERIEKSYRVITQEQEITFTSWQSALAYWYDQDITDEFIPPTQLNGTAYIAPEDGLIFFNFRADRARQLTRALTDPHFTFFDRNYRDIAWMITATSYHQDLPTQALYHQEIVSETLFDVLEQQQKTIFTIAETEKYAHVTYFFNGGREVVHQRETRILIPSLRKNSTYASTPEMSAEQITQTVVESLERNPSDFYLINYANADMVGHSGDFNATCQAIKCLDRELKRLYDTIVHKLNGTLYITSDHGKAEDMFDIQAQQPRTAHTVHKVPFLILNKELKKYNYHVPLEQLADIAPFILYKLNLPIPAVMKHNGS